MADWPMGFGCVDTGAESAESAYYGIMLATDQSGVNIKGSWTEIESSLPYSINLIKVVPYVGYNQQAILIDIAIGAASSETVILENLTYSAGYNYLYANVAQYIFPVSLPAGTRISGRYQANSLATSNFCHLDFLGYHTVNMPSFAGVKTYGAVTATSTGTNIDPGGTAGTFGSWVEFSAATDRTLKGVILGFPYWNNDYSSTSYSWEVQIGIGSSGSEVAVSGGIRCEVRPSSCVPKHQVTNFIPVIIPKGSRLCLRSKCSLVSDATDRILRAIIYGVY